MKHYVIIVFNSATLEPIQCATSDTLQPLDAVSMDGSVSVYAERYEFENLKDNKFIRAGDVLKAIEKVNGVPDIAIKKSADKSIFSNFVKTAD